MYVSSAGSVINAGEGEVEASVEDRVDEVKKSDRQTCHHQVTHDEHRVGQVSNNVHRVSVAWWRKK